MLGNITEKEPSRKVAPIVVGSSRGFPPVMRTVPTKRLPVKVDSDRNNSLSINNNVGMHVEALGKHPPLSKLTSDQTGPTTVPAVVPIASDESSEMNERMIQAMSHEEITVALDEIRSILSPKSIEFLLKGPVPTESSEKVTPIISTKQSQTLNLTPKVPLIPTSENPWHEDSTSGGITSHGSSLAVNVENPSVERYDLNGRKVVDVEAAVRKIKEEVRKSGLFNSSQAEEVSDLVAALCAECLAPMTRQDHKFFVWRHDALRSALHQPQDELKHHQFQSESPGYSLREITEMFRSEFANQRIMAMRMLSGILLRRECAVALEAYSTAFSTRDVVKDAWHIRCIQDEVGHESALFVELSTCFEEMVARVKGVLCTSTTSAEIELVRSSLAAIPAMSQSHELQVRKLLCWSSMHVLCAPDLPVELPTLLLWAMSSNINTSSFSESSSSADTDLRDMQLAPSFGRAAPRNNPATAKLSLLRCLYMYLCSPVEEACVDWIRTGSVLWSSYGTPRLSTPHTRRSGHSYEQDMADCLERSSKFLDEEDEEQQDEEVQRPHQPTPDSVAEAFALQCRWSRVSAIVSRGTVVASLTSHAVTAVENLLDINSKRASSNSGEVVTALGMASLQLLAVVARQGGDDILPMMHRQFLRSSWRVFVTMCDSDCLAESSALDGICRRWWVVLAELILRDRGVAAFLFETHAEWTGAVVLRLILRSRNTSDACADDNGLESISSIAARVLQYSLTYSFGFECVTEILMARQVQVIGTDSSSPDATQLFPFSFRTLAIFEQAAVSASAIFSAAYRKPASISTTATTTSQVPFDSLKIVSQAVQVSSSILSFIKHNWNELQKVVMNPSSSVELQTAVLSVISAVFERAQEQINVLQATLPEDFSSFCRLRMAQGIANDGVLRGCGLIFSAITFNAELLAVEQSKVGGSVTAAVLHLSGQSRDLVRFIVAQELFSLNAVDRCFAAITTIQANSRPRAVAQLQIQEHALALYRHLNIVVEFQFLDCSFEVLHAFYSKNSDRCCDHLEIGPQQRSANELVKGSIAEGILAWHYQRIQQAGLVLQITGAASLLLKFPSHDSTMGSSLDTLLAANLPKLSANSHSSILIRFAQAYVRRLIISCQTDHTTLVSTSRQYREMESKYESLVASIVKKASGCDFNNVDDCGISGSVPYKRAGEWMKLRGTANTAIALKQNWAFEVLLGDLSGEQQADWLQVLVSQNHNTISPLPEDGMLLASQLYTLLKLSTPDQASKWVNVGALHSQNDDVLTEVNQRAIEFYCTLLTLLVKHTRLFSSTFTATFCQVVSNEYFATTGMMSSLRHKLRAAKSGLSKYVNLEGTLDLCEKALDAGVNQIIDERLHSAVLIVLSSPLMPWSVRQRVWTQLSTLRILHVLEDRGSLLAFLPNLLPDRDASMSTDPRGAASSESLSLYLEMINGLTTLRAVADRSWLITAISIVQLAHFVFGETNWLQVHSTGGRRITRQRAQLLIDILALRELGTEAAWIPRSILSYLALAHCSFPEHHSWVEIIDTLTKECSIESDCEKTTLALDDSICNDWEVEMADRTFEKFRVLIEK